MANSNCNCSMSLLQKPCPRGVFDCRRCLTKMKNAGKVWQITSPSLITVAFILNTEGVEQRQEVIRFWPFETKLYWDFANSLGLVTKPDDVVYADIRCISGVYGRRFTSVAGLELNKDGFNPLDSDAALYLQASLYFEKKWWLAIHVWRNFPSSAPIPDYAGWSLFTTAHYESDQDSCFINAPAQFSLLQTNSAVTDDDVQEADIELEVVFPETVSFLHVENDGFIE